MPEPRKYKWDDVVFLAEIVFLVVALVYLLVHHWPKLKPLSMIGMNGEGVNSGFVLLKERGRAWQWAEAVRLMSRHNPRSPNFGRHQQKLVACETCEIESTCSLALSASRGAESREAAANLNFGAF
jgi:hypothetical protein